MKDQAIQITPYLSSMIAVEEHILDAVNRQLASKELQARSDAHETVGKLATTFERHIAEINRHLGDRDSSTIKKTLKQALGGTLGFAAGMYDRVRSDTASRMVRDDYTALSLAAISYHMLHTTALGMGEQDVAEMAKHHLADLTPLLAELSERVCTTVAHELGDEHEEFDASVAAQAVKNTQECWSAEHIYA